MGDKDFFPDDWDEYQVIDAIKSAFNNKISHPTKPNVYIGTFNGREIEMAIINDLIKTAYPR